MVRSFKRDIATVAITVLCFAPVSLTYDALQVNHARHDATAYVVAQVKLVQRRSDVTLCLALNQAVNDKMAKLIKQLRTLTTTSRRTLADQRAIEGFYTLLLTDFPKLDCSANPIDFIGPVP